MKSGLVNTEVLFYRLVTLVQGHHLSHYTRQQIWHTSMGRRLPRSPPRIGPALGPEEWRIARSLGH